MFGEEAPFRADSISPSCGPWTGGTKLAIHGSNFGFSASTSSTYLRRTDEIDVATIRFMHQDKLLATVNAHVTNSSKIECETVPYERPVLSATCETWGIVSLWITIHGSPYIECKQPFYYYIQPFIFDVHPRAISNAALLQTAPVNLSMRLTIADTPQTALTTAERDRIVQDMRRHPLNFCIRSARSSTALWRLNGNALVDDQASDGVPCSLALPRDLTPGNYSIQLAFNDFDYPSLPSNSSSSVKNSSNPWTTWHSHGQFTIFTPPTLLQISPSCCYFLQGQLLTIQCSDMVSQTADRMAIVHFERIDDGSTLRAQTHYKVLAAVTSPKALTIQTPRFHDAGFFRLRVSVNGGLDFSELPLSTTLLVYWKPCCEYVTPEYGVSMGATDLHLRISFANPNTQLRDQPNVALEDAAFEDRGAISVRFTAPHAPTSTTTRGAVTSDRKFIHCSTPRNATVESFRYSQLEAVALELTLDGVVFFPLTPKKPFSYYAPPKIRAFSTSQGPTEGGTVLHVHLIVPVPDHFPCELRFRGVKCVQDVAVKKSTDGLTLTCETPPWKFERNDPNSCGANMVMVLVELTLNGCDYESDFSEFVPCQHALFQGYERHFLYYTMPQLQTITPRCLSVVGHARIQVQGIGLADYGGMIQVAFSNGKMTKYVDGRIADKDVVACRAPPFPAGGVCLVSLALNGQQFTGEWTTSGHCIASDIQVQYIEEPIFTALTPTRGVTAGGTELRIFGQHFVDTGMVFVRFQVARNGYEQIVRGTVVEGVLTCVTPACPTPQRVSIDWTLSGDFDPADKIKPQFEFV
ncbi:hypothetical protein Ae201684_017312 [Aphanomyces euteiches]|uniref:IPT/TIG domain-containing protein n=1 Tax=Aphanomyces euteiches TaxID=100861 RepID=A0A6G0W9Q0_9STRA|nr:hypothetical protein Ae201684_017312 [Aphanomyces euteiches]KAH9145127.1 hypothetical protein AeRB84_010942 [Aphanomyces euteiches]